VFICDDKKVAKSGKKWQILVLIFAKLVNFVKKAPLEQKFLF
jgi:hypothetical protein